ncbi:MAG: hypothetical protein JWM59_2295 [Verrucomicrobiales bacterium]|nr:hypothetical protein [Verrucomicrobiales bacterium]
MHGYRCCEPEKKHSIAAASGYPPETFHNRLRDLCAHDIGCVGHDWARRTEDEAEQACAVGREYGILSVPGLTWAQFVAGSSDPHIGTEHLVEFQYDMGRVIKITIPPSFGLVPKVVTHAVPNLRGEPEGSRQALEFQNATPLRVSGALGGGQ